MFKKPNIHEAPAQPAGRFPSLESRVYLRLFLEQPEEESPHLLIALLHLL